MFRHAQRIAATACVRAEPNAGVRDVEVNVELVSSRKRVGRIRGSALTHTLHPASRLNGFESRRLRLSASPIRGRPLTLESLAMKLRVGATLGLGNIGPDEGKVG